jgi:hypothetical protein
VQQPQLTVVEVMRGYAARAVLGVVHGVGDELADMVILEAVEHLVPSRRVRTSRAILSLAKCWDTDGAGLPTRPARSLTANSRSASAHSS